MDLHSYRFTNVWMVSHAPGDVFAALTDLVEYPQWWWGFRSATRIDEETVDLVLKSALPYSLEVRERFAVLEPENHHATVEMRGDLAGHFDFRVTGAGRGSRVDFVLECTAERKLLRVLAPMARFAYRQNHEIVMRRGLTALERRIKTPGTANA